MQSTTPTPNGSAAYWNRKNFLPCDLAAAQLEYGPANAAGRYADCFSVTPGDGAKGLNSALTVTSGTSYTRCWNTSATVSGRLALAGSAAYEDMRNWPLSGRVVRIDRRPVGSTTWTNGSASATATGSGGSNWKATLTTASRRVVRLPRDLLHRGVRDRGQLVEPGHLVDPLDLGGMPDMTRRPARADGPSPWSRW